MSHDPLKELRAEFDRQNEALDQFSSTLRSLGDAEIAVPNAFLDELVELVTPRVNLDTPAMPIFGIRV